MYGWFKLICLRRSCEASGEHASQWVPYHPMGPFLNIIDDAVSSSFG